MPRKTIIIITTPEGQQLAFGSLTRACETLGWNRHTLKRYVGKVYQGYKLHRADFN